MGERIRGWSNKNRIGLREKVVLGDVGELGVGAVRIQSVGALDLTYGAQVIRFSFPGEAQRQSLFSKDRFFPPFLSPYLCMCVAL